MSCTLGTECLSLRAEGLVAVKSFVSSWKMFAVFLDFFEFFT